MRCLLQRVAMRAVLIAAAILAALCAAVAPAHAQTTLWTATLTVAASTEEGDAVPAGYCSSASGRCSSPYGMVSDNDFTLQGTSYTVESVRWGDGSRAHHLHLTLDKDLPGALLSRLTFTVGSDDFGLSDASRSITTTTAANNYRWTGTQAIRDLAVDAEVTVKLVLADSDDATLSVLALSPGTLAPPFVATTEAYTAAVEHRITQATLTATPNDSAATVRYLDSADRALADADSNTGGHQVALSTGQNTIKVEVSAEDGTTTKTYTVTVTRALANTDATLTALAIDPGTLTPAFAYGTHAYTASVAHAIGQITVTPTANQSGATIEYLDADDMAIADADAMQSGHQAGLSEGTNTIKVKVTAPNRTATRTYTVTVTRAPDPCRVPTYAGGNREVLNALLTAGSGTVGTVKDTIGYRGSGTRPFGTLSPARFTAGGRAFTINALAEDTGADRLTLSLSATPTATQANRLTLYVCDDAFPLSARLPATGTGANTFVLDARELGLTDGAKRRVRVAYDDVAPTLVSTRRSGTRVTLTWSEMLDPDSVPPASAFRVTVGGSAAALASTNPVTVSGREVTLDFAEASTASMMVAYTAPAGAGAKPLRDLRRNRAADFAEPMFNHAPTAPPETYVTLDEDTRYVLRSADFAFSDVDEGDEFAGIRIGDFLHTRIISEEDVRVATLTLDGAPVERDQLVSRADIDAGKLVFTPEAHINATVGIVPFLGYRVGDGKEYSTADSYIRFRITPVPDPTTWNRDFVYFTAGPARTPGATVQLNVTDIEDADGIPSSVNYRVQRVDADGVSNPVDLGSGTVNREDRTVNYTLVTADVGKRIRGIVSFTDGGGEAVTLVSTATGVVQASGTMNARPSGANATVTLAEDGSYTFKTSDFGFTDSNPEDVFVDLEIANEPGAGTLRLGKGAVAFDSGERTAGIKAIDIAAGLLTYTPEANGHGDPYTSFTFSVYDTQFTAGSGADRYTMTIDVTPVNDAPTGRPAITGARQVGQTLTASTAGMADADGLPATLSYRWMRVDTDGVSNPIGIVEANASTYTLATSELGKRVLVRVTYTDDDGTTETLESAPSGVVQASGTTNTAPEGADRTLTIKEDTARALTVPDFGFTDADAGDALAGVTVVTLPVRGALTLGGAAVAANQAVSAHDLQASASRLVFTPEPNAHGAGHASFTFKVSDGTDESASANTVTFDVTSVNDAATGKPTVSGSPRVGQVLRADSAGMADTEGMTMARAGATGHAFTWQWVRVDADGTSNPTDIANATSSSYELTAADAGKRIRARVRFTDDAGTAEGPVESDPWPTSGTVKTTGADNAAPTGTSVRIWTGEETDYVFEARDFGFSDPDAGDTLAKVKVATLPGKGALTLAGTAVTAGQDVAVGDIDAGKLRYNAQLTTRTAGATTSSGYTSFTFKVSDGTADSVATSTVTFDIPGRPNVHGVRRVPARLVGEFEPVFKNTSLARMRNAAAFSLQWTRVDGTTETDIPGATSPIYHLQEADAGKQVKVKATFTDARGRRVTAVRPFPDTGTILPAAPACAAPVYNPGTAEVWKSLLYVGNAPQLNLPELEYGSALGLRSIDDIPLGLLTNPFLRIGSTSHEIEQVDAESPHPSQPAGGLTLVIHPGPSMEQRRKLVLHACGRSFALRDAETSEAGARLEWTNTNMDWSTTALRTLRMSYDEAPPTLVSTRRSGAKVMLTFSEDLDADSVPAASAFEVKVGATAASLASSGAVAVSGDTVTLTLASAPAASAVPTARYTKPTGTGAKPLRDLAHNEVAGFGARSANHAPTITTASPQITTLEDTPYVLSVSDFGFADDDPGDTLASVRITRATYLRDEDVGLLVLDGVTVTHGAVIPRADIDAGRLRYVPPPDIHHQALESFEYTVSDGKDDSVNRAVYYGEVRAVNDPPTGKPVISGTRRVGQVLTATTATIEDPDGAPSGGFRFTYQWFQVDADGASNATEIQGATGSTYTLTPEDLGKRILVWAYFSDADGNYESLASDATGTVQAQDAPMNRAPTAADKTVTTTEDTSHVFQIADFGFADSDNGDNGDDGDTLQSVTVVTLPSEGTLTVGGAALAAGGTASATDIALGRFLFTPAAHAHGDPYASFTFKVSDGTADSADTYTMTVDVTSVNDPATGKPEIMGTRQVGQTLTASTDDIDDAEGLPVTLGYQWVRVDADGTSNPTDISGATSSTYTPGTDDLGKRLRVRVSFTDLDGNAESVSSELTGAIQASGTTNAAPTAADFTILASTEPGYTFRTADFGFADTNMGDVLTSVTVVTVPRLGRLALGGTAVRPRQVVNATDIGAGRLTYAVASDGTRTSGYASFTFRVSDGSDESASAHAVTIDSLGAPLIYGDIVTRNRLRVPAALTAFTDSIPPTAGTTPASGYAYQWVRVDGSTETDIAGATEASYTLTSADSGKRIRLKVLFDDPRGVRVTATSPAYPFSGSILGPAACAMPVLAGGATQVWSADLRTFETIDLASSLRYGYGGDNGSLSDDEVEVGTSRYTVELVSDAYDGVGGQFGFRTSPALHGAHRQRLVLHICDAALALRDATESGGTYTWRDTALDWSGNVIVQRDLYLSYDDAAPTLSESARTGAAVTLTFSEALDSGAVPAASAFGITVNGTAATLAATSPVAIADETVTLTLAATPPVGATVAVTYTKPATGAKLRDPAHNDVATFTEEIVVAANSELGALSLSDGRLDPLFDPAHATYTASVDHATARITVTASPRHPDGTIQYLDSADAALADAEPGTDGHQVDLDAGANTIRVKVTSGDRARTSTYMLTVTRKAGEAPSMPRAFTAAAAPGKAYLAWQAPATDGGSGIARYEYRYRTGTASYPATWTQIADGADPGTSAADERFVTVTGLANDQAHTFELRAVNTANQTSAAAESATVTPTAGHDCGVPSYPSGTRQVLIAQMVAGTGTGTAAGSSHSLRGFLAGPGGFGTLSATTFTLGADTYTLDFVGEAAGSDHFFISVDRFPSDAQLQRMTVYVCRKAYQLIGDPKVSRLQAEKTFFIDDGEIGLDDRPVRVVRIAYQADATDATLGALSLDGATLNPAFSPATETYTASVELATARTTINARPAEPGATVAYLDDADEAITDADTETDGHQVDLDTGLNIIKVEVTATNTTTTKTYEVRVRRGDDMVSDDASLSALTVSPGTLDPPFDAATTAYAVELIFSETRVTVTAETTHEGATVAYLDGSDAALADADDAVDGLQVDPGTGDSVIQVKVTAEDDTTTKTYTVTVTRAAAASTDATLSGLTLSAGTLDPVFASATTAYSASVGNAEDEVTVTPVVTHRGATVEYLDGSDTALADADTDKDGHQVALEVGETVVKVNVTAEDGSTTKTYTLTLTRVSADATLSGLSLSAGTLDPPFDAATTSYTASVIFSEDEITVTPEASDPGATVEYLGASDTALADADTDKDGHQVDLGTGANTIKVKVTAEDGSTTKTYTVTVTRAAAASTDATLSGLTLSAGTLDPVFASATTSYAASVGNAEDEVTVTPEAAHAGATVEYLDSGDTALADADTEKDGHQVALEVGETVVKVKVTAEDDTATETYTLTLTRASADEAEDPYLPTNVRAAANVPLSIEVSWTAPTTTPSRLAVDISGNGKSWSTQRCTQYVINCRVWLSASATSYTHTAHLGGGSTRHYRIFADHSGTANDGHSDTVSATTSSNPRAFAARAGGSAGETTIDVSWTALAKLGADAVTGYGIEVSTDEGDTWQTLVANTGSTATSYVHGSLSRGALRHYRVRAIAGTRMSGFGRSAWARTTPNDPGKPVLTLTKLPDSGELVTWRDSEGQILLPVRYELSWPRPDDGGEGDLRLTYQFRWDELASAGEVYRNDQGHDAVELFAPSAAALSFRVRALNEVGENCSVTAACAGAGPWSDSPSTIENAGKVINRANAASLLGRFSGVPGRHDGSTRFQFELRFDQEPEDLSYRTVQGGLLMVDGGSVVHARRFQRNSSLRWEVTVQPAGMEDVSITLPVRECSDANAVCVDGQPLAEEVTTTVAHGGAAVTGLPTVTAPGGDGVYTKGERIEARVAFDTAVTVDVSAGSPTLGLALGGVRREASYESGSGTDELVFAYTAVEADAGAAQAKAIANGIVLNGATIQGEGDADAVLAFGEAPGVASVEIGEAPGGDGAWGPAETLEVELVFEEPVEVDTSGGVPSIGALVGAGEKTLSYVRGSETDRPVFSYTLVEADGQVTSVRVPEGSPALNGGAIRSTAGLDASLAHNGAGREGAPRAVLPVVSVADAEAAEGATLAFAVTLAPAASAPVTVDWATADGTATAGSDYTAASGTLAFAAGETEKTVEVATATDAEAEAAETLTLTLSNASGATIGDGGATGTVTDPGPAAFTGSFAKAPPEHDGASAFTLEFLLSEQPRGLGWGTVKDHLFDVTGGAIERAQRIEGRVRNTAWLLTVAPSGNEKVTLTLKATAACESEHDVCTTDQRMLEGGPMATIAGPAALSVADATADEEPGATLDFVVTLDRARHAAVTVDYATGAEGDTATAGSDYTATSGKLTFAAGTTSKTVKVTVLDDSHDDDGETMTFKLSNPQGARIEDGEATGTIKNTDAMPQAWIARFGRTVAEQVVDAVEARLEAPRTAGVEASLAGQPLGGTGPVADADEALERREAEEAMTALAEWLGGEDAEAREGAGFESRAVSGREVLLGSSFALTGGSAETGFGALWGRASVSGFDGREGDLEVDGEVTSALLGADWSRGGATAGLAVAHSRGDGSYRSPGGDGEAESTLTGVYPYGRYALNRTLSVWGVAGLGRGTLTLEPEGGARIETDLELAMGAVGLRGVLVEAPADGGMELAAKTDGMAVRTSSAAARGADGGNMAASEADVTRLRLGLQATWHGMDAGGGVLTPTMELGVRHDGGDAETGYGADIGAGLSWSDPARGLTADVRARALLMHEAEGFRERGVSGTLSWDPEPSTELGPSLTLSQTLGAASSGGAEALLGRRHLEGLVPGDGGDDPERRSLDARLGYGFALFGGGYTGTPELGLGLTEAHREVSLGWRLAEVRSAGLAFGLDVEGARRESAAGEAAPEHRLGLGLGWRLEGAGTGIFELRFEGARLDAANDDAENRVEARISARW